MSLKGIFNSSVSNKRICDDNFERNFSRIFLRFCIGEIQKGIPDNLSNDLLLRIKLEFEKLIKKVCAPT